MREATIILFVIIVSSLILGLAYNTMSPYLEKLGLKGAESEGELARDGGIFVSRDGGLSWEQAGILPQTPEEESQLLDVTKLRQSDILDVAFDPHNENQIYIGAASGLYSYNPASNEITLIDNIGGNVLSIAPDPTNSERIYIAVKSVSGGRILKTARSRNFYEVYSTLEKSDMILGVWIDFDNPSSVFAGTQTGLLLESKDFGESWSIKKEFNEPLKFLKMSPDNTRLMYAIIGNSGLYRSFNSGGGWQDISSSFSANQKDPQFAVKNLEINQRSANELYAATNKGVFLSANGGGAFSEIGLIVSEKDPDVLYVALDELTPNVLYVGIDSQIHKTTDKGLSWQIKTLPTARRVNIVKVSPFNPNLIVVGVKSELNPLLLK